jgi:quercetin dioxygenase-like cupin family protein
MILRDAAARAVFSADKMSKVTLGAGDRLFAGLNCFEPGQSHHAHVHPEQDKLYVILAGEGEAEVGPERARVRVGDVILAPAGVPHALANPGPERLTALVVFSPPPR